MGVSVTEGIGLQDGPDKLSIALEQLVEHLLILYVVAATRSLSRHWSVEQLRFGDGSDLLYLVQRLLRGRIVVLLQIVHR